MPTQARQKKSQKKTKKTKKTKKAKKPQGSSPSSPSSSSTTTPPHTAKAKTKKKAKAAKKAPGQKKLKAKGGAATSSRSKGPSRRSGPKAAAPGLPSSRSTGVLLWQRRPVDAVLALWRRDGSPDLPKGHVKSGESDADAAMRELHEETGILPARVRLHRERWFENTYRTRHKGSGRLVNKTVRIFLAEVDGPVVVSVSDHADYAWLRADDRAALIAAVTDNPTFADAVAQLIPSTSSPATLKAVAPARGTR